MVRHVTIYNYSRTPPAVVASVELRADGQVQFSSRNARIHAQLEHGVRRWPSKELITAKDGSVFLDAVLKEFSGAYVRAVEEPLRTAGGLPPHDDVRDNKGPRAAGGPGSGNFGHAGRPGEVGGSAPGDGGSGGGSSAVDTATTGAFRPLPPGVETSQAGMARVDGKVDEALTKQAQAATVEKGLVDGNEHLFVVDAKTGKVLSTHDGDDHSVQMPPDMQPALVAGTVRVEQFHNHPNHPTSLSDADISQLNYDGITRAVAYTEDGSSFSASRGPHYHPGAVQTVTEAAQAATFMLKDFGGFADSDDEFDLYVAGQHASNQAMAQFGIVNYEYHLSPVLKQRLSKLPVDDIRQMVVLGLSPAVSGLVKATTETPWSSAKVAAASKQKGGA